MRMLDISITDWRLQTLSEQQVLTTQHQNSQPGGRGGRGGSE